MTFEEWRKTGVISPRVIKGVDDSPPGIVYEGGWWIAEEQDRSKGRQRWFAGGRFSDFVSNSLSHLERILWDNEVRPHAVHMEVINSSLKQRKQVTQCGEHPIVGFREWQATGYISPNVSESLEDPTVQQVPGIIYRGECYILEYPDRPDGRFWTYRASDEYSSNDLQEVEFWLWENLVMSDDPVQQKKASKEPDRTAKIATLVAEEFCEQLRKHVAEETITRAVEANRLEPNKGICHLHSFCDPNQIMIDALKALDLHWRSEIFDEAYDIAKSNHFAL